VFKSLLKKVLSVKYHQSLLTPKSFSPKTLKLQQSLRPSEFKALVKIALKHSSSKVTTPGTSLIAALPPALSKNHFEFMGIHLTTVFPKILWL
jgi:hypothetical protein